MPSGVYKRTKKCNLAHSVPHPGSGVYVRTEEHKESMRGRTPWNKGKKGGTAWNKGLTKETDERVAKNARGTSNTKKGKLKIPRETRICKCGCGGTFICKVTSTQRYLPYHHARIQSKSMREVNSNRTKQLWKDPKYRKKQSKSQLALWEDPEYRDSQIKAIMEGSAILPNKPEKALNKVLDNLFPKEYKYVGDGNFIIAGKCPDFININGQKKIIELFGDYWHKDDNPQDRIDIFSPYGYKTLVIWEHELEDRNKLEDQLLKFHSLVGECV